MYPYRKARAKNVNCVYFAGLSVSTICISSLPLVVGKIQMEMKILEGLLSLILRIHCSDRLSI